MKSCPSCNRTFEDSLTFCLVDGAVLSAPYDPQVTQRIPPPRNTDPPPTEVLYPPTQPAIQTPPLSYPTIPAPPPPLYSDKQRHQPEGKRSPKTWLILGIGLLAGAIIVMAAGSIWSGKDNPVENKSNTAPKNANAQSQNANAQSQNANAQSKNANAQSQNANALSNTTSSKAPCFAVDSPAVNKKREEHYSWAQKRDANVMDLSGNLTSKAERLFNCPAMNEDSLSSVFADISVAIARYVPDAKCFSGDTGVTSTDREGHKNFYLRSPDRKEELVQNLQWKMSGALRCLDQEKRSSYFADLSVIIATAAQ